MKILRTSKMYLKLAVIAQTIIGLIGLSSMANAAPISKDLSDPVVFGGDDPTGGGGGACCIG